MVDYLDLIVRISLAEKRLKKVLRKMEKQRKKLYENVKKAVIDGDELSARNYATRIVSLIKQERKLQKFLDYLEQAKLRIEKAHILSELGGVISTLEKLERVSGLEDDRLEEFMRNLELSESLETRVEDEELVEKIVQQAKTESIKELEELLPSPEGESIELEEK